MLIIVFEHTAVVDYDGSAEGFAGDTAFELPGYPPDLRSFALRQSTTVKYRGINK